ncbi:hypothetical protein AGMMS49545_06080 [Betaproteobacteria bacterium]|nr:hypothetical protein AGMMS49545_06080 [Betaproteobacteria bacterium]
MLTHEKLMEKILSDPEVRAEAGLTQAQVAAAMGTKASAVARLEVRFV